MLTKSELEIMNLLWDIEQPLTSSEIVTKSVTKSWKKSYVNLLINSLLKKKMIEVTGFKQMTKNYARTFVPTMSRDEYNINQLSAQPGFNKKSIPALFSQLVEQTDDNQIIDELDQILKKRRDELK